LSFEDHSESFLNAPPALPLLLLVRLPENDDALEEEGAIEMFVNEEASVNVEMLALFVAMCSRTGTALTVLTTIPE
jgi:hypothetical protein